MAEVLSNTSINTGAAIFLLILFILCIPLYQLDKHVLKKLTAWFIKFSKAAEPVVIEEPAAVKTD